MSGPDTIRAILGLVALIFAGMGAASGGVAASVASLSLSVMVGCETIAAAIRSRK